MEDSSKLKEILSLISQDLQLLSVDHEKNSEAVRLIIPGLKELAETLTQQSA